MVTDESWISLSGIVNTKRCCKWGSGRAQQVYQAQRNASCLMPLCPATERSIWILSTQNPIRDRRELQKYAWVLCNSKTLRISMRHDCLTGWCSSSLFGYIVSVFTPTDPQPLNVESWSDVVTSSFTRVKPLQLRCIKTCERYIVL